MLDRASPMPLYHQLKERLVANVAPGSYTLEIVDHQGVVSGGSSVSIREGQATTIKID